MIPRVPVFQDMHLRDVLARQDNITRPWSAYLATEIALNATPFNRLSVWAYIAFAFVVLAVSTIVGYMSYNCCHSARRQYYGTETRTTRRMGDLRLNSAKRNSNHWIRGGRYKFGEEKGESVAEDGKRRDVKEKDALKEFRIGRTVWEAKKLGLNSKSSESVVGLSLSFILCFILLSLTICIDVQENIVQYHASVSHNSQYSTPKHSFEVENQYPTSPPLAHTNERSAAYIPFHLPPPPSSPTPAYKEFLESQKQFYRGKQLSHSPVSPSPSPFPDRSPPNLFKASILSPFQKPSKDHSRSKVATANKGATQPTSAFDSNNIRFASPLNPFMTPTTIFRWNDPKLSPVAGSFITSSPMNGSHDYFSSQTTPGFSANKRATRLLSPQLVSEPGGNGYEYREKDNLHPISHARFGQQENRF
jgi:hypothetical protein